MVSARVIGAISAIALIGTATGLAVSAPASATTVPNVVITATETGISAAQPTNGTLYLYDNAVALHHTRSIDYYQHDGYEKTEILNPSGNPKGVILKEEDIENACKSSTKDGSENPVGGYDIGCVGVLSNHPVSLPLGGDLIGRFCRVAQFPDTNPSDCTSDLIHVTENATGNGQYLQVGNKDHGAMKEIDYYTNVTGVNEEVDVKLPGNAEVTKVVILPQAIGAAPSATLVLNG